ncbi:MAG: DUF1549 and DUF1553 domain-containing protein [Verrucomicrobiota bacterium]|nr:DUF1549 and DUF1553 domain-containing protein [Verrucomicrobiota bacterium]
MTLRVISILPFRFGVMHAFLFIFLFALALALTNSGRADESPRQAVASDPSHWSFQRPTKPGVPHVSDRAWPRSDLDCFLLAKLEEAGVAPFGPADKRMLIRRTTYDLTGLPPTPNEVDAFLADTSPDPFANLVERLLASPRYGERWGRHWLDVVRYADTAGENTDMPVADAWRYRNYVIRAFNEDKPFDQFIREQLAGDILAKADPKISAEQYSELVTATGYLAISRRHGHDAKKDHYLTIEDTIDTLGKSFLGLTLACARCHDHKYDPISARDYYGLYGIFASTVYSFPGSEGNKTITDLMPLKHSKKTAENIAGWNKRKTELEQKVGAAKKKIAASTTKFSELDRQPATLLAEGQIDIREEEPFAVDELTVRRGDMIQLIVDPKDGNHGADTTIIEWELTEVGGESWNWNVKQDVLDNFLVSNPHPDRLGNPRTWAFLDARQPGKLLTVPVKDNENRAGNHVWRVDPLPSVFVNANNTPIPAWTTLPPRTFFVHPAADGPVGVGWTSPIDGRVRIRGLVKDGHPYGNGVAWKLVHKKGDFLPTITNPQAELATLQTAKNQLAEWLKKEVKIDHAYGAAEGNMVDEKLHRRGDPTDLGESVGRKNIDLLGGQKVTEGSGRLQLAEWIGHPENPLTARVIVNRVWLNHFGRGLVTTPNDFGSQGQTPTHPELLDWLALRFVESGWSIKQLHRLIMNSTAYQLSAGGGPEQKLYGSFQSRRLSAEELRDSLLALGQTLDCSTPAGHPFPPTRNYTQHNPFRANYEHNHRSVFLMTQRIQRRPLMALFDGADANASTGQRRLSNVPTQTLYFLNNDFLHRQAAALAVRLAKRSGNPRDRNPQAHRLALGRSASKPEITQAREFIAAYTADADETRAWDAWCRVLLSSNEFLYLN